MARVERIVVERIQDTVFITPQDTSSDVRKAIEHEVGVGMKFISADTGSDGVGVLIFQTEKRGQV